MDMYGGRRTQAERDAMTVEIGYALVSAAFLAAVVFGVLAGPVLLFELPDSAGTLLERVAIVLVPVVFFVRVATVLYRYRQGAGQPSQPGRTNPDS